MRWKKDLQPFPARKSLKTGIFGLKIKPRVYFFFAKRGTEVNQPIAGYPPTHNEQQVYLLRSIFESHNLLTFYRVKRLRNLRCVVVVVLQR